MNEIPVSEPSTTSATSHAEAQEIEWQRVLRSLSEDHGLIDSATTIEEILPGTADLKGDPLEVIDSGPIRRALPLNPSWPDVAALQVGTMQLMFGIGPARFRKIIEQIRSALGGRFAPLRDGESSASPRTGVSHERTLGELVPGMDRLSGDPRETIHYQSFLRLVSPSPEWSEIAELELGTIRRAPGIGPKRLSQVIHRITNAVEAAQDVAARRAAALELSADWSLDEACDLLLSVFRERDRLIIERILEPTNRKPTLEAVAAKCDLTRERVRQLESRIARQLDQRLSDPEFEIIARTSDELRTVVRAMAPIDSIPDRLFSSGETIAELVTAHAAGPYVIDGGWLRLQKQASPRLLLRSAFDHLDLDGVCRTSALREELENMDVNSGLLERFIAEFQDFRIFGEWVIDWRRSLHQKAISLLLVHGHPMTKDELIEMIDPPNPRSMMNQVSTEPRIVTVGRNRFALASWGLGRYDGIVPAMTDRLQDGPRDVNELASELSVEFGISPKSVVMHSSMHPAFVVDGGTVRLRREDEPYVSKATLERSPDCELNEAGLWRIRIPIDRDIERGSGRHFPEAFAVHLGLEPLSQGEITSSLGVIPVAWQQTPTMGSLRRIVGELGGRLGDDLLITALGDWNVDYSIDRIDVIDDFDLY